MKATVLVIDDAETIRHFLPRELRAEGYQVLTADSGQAGLQILETEPVDLALLDMRMPDLSGIQVLERISQQWPDQVVVLPTGAPDHETARQQKQGVLELANGGTLVLEEVGEMSLTIQVKLLRVLERMTFKRVGGTKDITVSVRVISATNQNLESMVREQRFREDLFYRLKVVPIRVPPLRERREDILPLARHFLAQFTRLFGKG